MTYVNSVLDLVRMSGVMHGLSVSEILSRSAMAYVARPRQEIMCALYRSKRMTYPQISQALDRHHATVIHACRRIAELEAKSPALRRRVDELTAAAALTDSLPKFVSIRPTKVAFKSTRAANDQTPPIKKGESPCASSEV